jgi:hypothetical protein
MTPGGGTTAQTPQHPPPPRTSNIDGKRCTWDQEWSRKDTTPSPWMLLLPAGGQVSKVQQSAASLTPQPLSPGQLGHHQAPSQGRGHLLPGKGRRNISTPSEIQWQLNFGSRALAQPILRSCGCWLYSGRWCFQPCGGPAALPTSAATAA